MGGIFSKKQQEDVGDVEYDNGLTPDQEEQLKKDFEEIDKLIYSKCKQHQPKLCALKSAPKLEGNRLITDLITKDDINHEYLREIFKGEDSELAVALIHELRIDSIW
jgi:hypothetical protein